MRKEGIPDQKGDHKGGKHQDKFKGQRRPFKGGHRKDHKKGGKHSGERLPKDPEARKEFLDKEMEQYWIKGGHKELGKSKVMASILTFCLAQASLDAELDNYMAKAADTGAA